MQLGFIGDYEMALNKYTFSHNFDKKYLVRVSTDSDTAYDIVTEFVAFLRACQFCDSAIKDALEGGVEDIIQNVKYVDK